MIWLKDSSAYCVADTLIPVRVTASCDYWSRLTSDKVK